MVESITPIEAFLALKSHEDYIVYLNFIASDLIKLIRKNGKEDNINNLSHINSEDFLQFLLNSLPKVLYNVILPSDVVPPQYRQNPM